MLLKDLRSSKIKFISAIISSEENPFVFIDHLCCRVLNTQFVHNSCSVIGNGDFFLWTLDLNFQEKRENDSLERFWLVL